VWQEEIVEHEDKKELMKLMMFMERSRKDFLESKAESDQVTYRAVLLVFTTQLSTTHVGRTRTRSSKKSQ
jgi:hypothetical protein